MAKNAMPKPPAVGASKPGPVKMPKSPVPHTPAKQSPAPVPGKPAKHPIGAPVKR